MDENLAKLIAAARAVVASREVRTVDVPVEWSAGVPPLWEQETEEIFVVDGEALYDLESALSAFDPEE